MLNLSQCCLKMNGSACHALNCIVLSYLCHIDSCLFICVFKSAVVISDNCWDCVTCKKTSRHVG